MTYSYEIADAAAPPDDRWMATLAHELRNPLNSIVLALGVLHPACAGQPDLRDAHDIAEHGSRHMARIIDDVLDLCRGTHGKLSFCAETVDLATVVSAAVRGVRPLIDARRHRLAVSLPPRPTLLKADASRLEQVLTNLLTNAAKFTAPGGHVDLIAAATATNIVIHVRDDGVGIAPGLLPHVFELYRQGDAARDASAAGLGIGLALVRSLVELHGGDIVAHSDGPGSGAEFILRLPIDGPAQAATRPAR